MRSVTVTSFTDVFAFGVGAFTQMPGLQSFCVCTAIALGCIYVLQVRHYLENIWTISRKYVVQVSWFVAWLVLDEKRILARRHGLVPCLTLPRGRGDSEAGCCGAANPVLRLYSGLLGSRLYQVRAACVEGTLNRAGNEGSQSRRRPFLGPSPG